jgi:hypothetical protein
MAEAVELKLPCPLCGKEHSYSLVVQRSVTMGLVPGRTPPPEVQRQFVRSVMCPTTAARFQATLRLSETAATRITRLTVDESVEEAT